jgi:hypothetical protein
MGSLAAPGPTSPLSNDVLVIVVPFPPNQKWMDHLQAVHPGLTVRWVTQGHKNPPDPLPVELFDGVTLLCTRLCQPAELLQNVRYVQAISAGADRWITHELYQKPDVVLCTANGAHAYAVFLVPFPITGTG